MAYTPTVWKNREVERPRTYQEQKNPDGTVTLIPKEGNVIEPGTPIIADTMNKMELGIKEAHDGLTEIGDVSEDLAAHLAEKTSKTTYGHVKVGNGINVNDGVISVAEMTASNVTTTGGSDVQTEIDSLKSSVSDGKNNVRDVITGKGGTVADGDNDGVPTFGELASGVESLGTVSTKVGETPVLSALSSSASSGSSMTKRKEIRWLGGAGKVRVSFDLRSNQTSTYGYARVYINDIPVGIQRAKNSVTFSTYTQDFDVKPNDLIQLFAYSQSTGMALYQNFIVKMDLSDLGIVLLDT